MMIFIIINVRKIFLRMVKLPIQIMRIVMYKSTLGVKMEIKRILRGFSYDASLSLQLNQDTLHFFIHLSSLLHPCK